MNRGASADMVALAQVTLSGNRVDLLSPTAVPLIACVAATLLYLRACSVLRDRGRHVPVAQRVSFLSGLALILLATQTALDTVSETSLQSLHMAQHLLIADIPAPLLLYGLRAPVLYFFWPKPVLVRAARMRWLRGAWAWLRQPQVAISVWLVTLYAWHIPALYDAALHHRLVHDVEHLSFALGGMLVWWPLLDPTHERVDGRIWKVAYVVAARMIGGILGIILLAWPRPLYPAYGQAARDWWGLTPLTDQQIAGGMMMIVDSLVIMFAATLFLVTMDRGAEHARDVPLRVDHDDDVRARESGASHSTRVDSIARR